LACAGELPANPPPPATACRLLAAAAPSRPSGDQQPRSAGTWVKPVMYRSTKADAGNLSKEPLTFSQIACRSFHHIEPLQIGLGFYD
jgi:hypothetical protein